MLRSLVCALATATLAACAPASRLETIPSPVRSRVLVHNYSWDHMALYVGRQGLLWRIGQVDALSDVTLPLPRAAGADIDAVYFVARPIAGGSFRSESVAIPSGGTAIWTIQNQTATSHVALR